MYYRRANTNNASYFFTVDLVNTKQRLLTENIHVLRQVIHAVKQLHLFNIQAIVILPEHLHTVWTLPENDADYPKRWSLIKANFSRSLPKTERINSSRMVIRERGIWQRRYWEHQIRDDLDMQRHIKSFARDLIYASFSKEAP